MSALVAVSIIALAASAGIVAFALVTSLGTIDRALVGGMGIIVRQNTTTTVIENTGALDIEFPIPEYTSILVQGISYVTKNPAEPRTAFGSGNTTSLPIFRLLENSDMPQIPANQIDGVALVIQGGTGDGTGLLGNGSLLIVSSVNGTIVEGPSTVDCCVPVEKQATTVVEAGDGIAVVQVSNHTYSVSTTGLSPIAKGGTNSGVPLVGDRVILSNTVSLYESPPILDGRLFIGVTGSSPILGIPTAGNGAAFVTGPGLLQLSFTGDCTTANETFSPSCVDISAEDCITPVQTSCIPADLALVSLDSGTTALGTTTTCATPIADNCAPISGKTCTGGVLGSNCIAQDLILNSLHVNNLIAVNSTQQTILTANATELQVEQLTVTGQLHLSGNMNCSSSPLSSGCIDVSGFSCPGGSLDITCLPTNPVFGNLQSTGTLSVQAVSCLGSALPNNCVDISGKTCTASTLASSCIPLRLGTINGIAPEATGGDFGITAGTGIVITPASNGIVMGNTGVTSVALAVPSSIMSVSGSPVTTTGTLAVSLNDQAANTAFAGPTTGASAAPAFRTQALADLPQLTNGQLYVGSTGSSVVATTITAGTDITVTNGAGSITIASTAPAAVTSVALSLPSIFSVSGSPVTSTGTLTATLATQSANTLFAGAASGGAATPTFRAPVIADISSPLNYQVVSTISEYTTTSSTPTVIPGMTISAPAAGTYYTNFEATFASNAGCTLLIQLYNGATGVENASTRWVSGFWGSASVQAVMIMNGSDSITARFSRVSGSCTCYVNLMSLYAMRIAA